MPASDNIDSFIAELADWRGQMLTNLRGRLGGAD
jgi:hypothetical protein